MSTNRLRHSLDVEPLLEFSALVNSGLTTAALLDAVLLSLMGKFLLTRSVVLLPVGGGIFRIANGKGVPASVLSSQYKFPRRRKTSVLLSADSRSCAPELYHHGIRRLLPLLVDNAVVGYVGLGGAPKNRDLTANDVEFAQAMAHIAASALQKAMGMDIQREANRELDRHVQQLRTLFELSKEFGAILDREKILKLLGFTLMGQLGVNSYAVCLREAETFVSRLDVKSLLPFKERMLEAIHKPSSVRALGKSKRMRELRAQCEKMGIEVLVPLQTQNETRGMMCLGSRLRGGGYSEADLEFIYSLGNLAIISLENTRLFAETVEKQKMENELAIAREIQNGLLPQMLPEIPSFEISALNLPSKQVGGDYYDVINLENDRFMIAIGDVSGKGTPASLLMANVQAIVRTLAHIPMTLSEMTQKVNHLICENTGSGKFITFFWGILDPASRKFRYVNAGHNHPFVVRFNGTIERLHEGGIVLGVVPHPPPYTEGEVILCVGDFVVMFTDGISEAMNTEGVDYTEERVEQFLRQLASTPAGGIVVEIRAAI
ncbi:MAG: SpoIIE family protein phosphatase, partial [Ignavibacteriales bacterium]|nr:SpoIIE family protein phosphatase [Ignavibacteriales bacterium]